MIGCLNKANRLIVRIVICLSFLIAKSAYCETEMLTGTISLPASMTSNDSEHKLKIYITESDKDNVETAKSTKLVDILPGSTSVNYQIDYPQPHKNNKVSLRIHCYRGCDFLDGLSSFFELQGDGSFYNKRAWVSPELLLSEQNLQYPELPPSKTLKGTISLPDSMSRNENDIEVSVVIRVSSSNYNDQVYFSRSGNVTIESGKTSADYEIDYYLLSPNHNIMLRFHCGSNCRTVNPLQKAFTLLDDGSFTDDNPFINNVKWLPASTFPERLDFQIPKPPIKKTLTGTFSLPDSIRVSKGGNSISVAVEVLDKDGEPADFRRTINLRVPRGSTKVSYELDYYLPKGSSQARVSFLCGQCDKGFGKFKYLQKDGSYSLDDRSDPIPIGSFPEKIDYQYDGQTEYSLYERFWWWLLNLGR